MGTFQLKPLQDGHLSKVDKNFCPVSVHFREVPLYFKNLDDLCSAKIKDPENMAVYRVGHVLFGLSSSLFLLSSTLIHHAHNCALLNPEFVLHFIKPLHVDDLISGADSLQEVERFYLKCKECLATANFNLRKICFKFREPQLSHKQCYTLK